MATSVIVGTGPRRGRGPGSVKFEDGVEATTFDSPLVRLASASIGKEATYEIKEKENVKNPDKPFVNLVSLAIKESEAPQDAPVRAEEPLQGQVIDEEMPQLPKRGIVPLRALQGYDDPIRALEQGFALAIRQRELLEDFVKKRFKEKTHYVNGSLFGQGKNSKDVLLQPGAQLILYAHGYSAIPEIIAGPLEAPKDPQTSYTITTRVDVFNNAGVKVGSCIGSASSLIWSGRYSAFVPRAVDSDKTMNTTMKMSQKRAMVGACIQSTAASEMFTQDAEEGGYSDQEMDSVIKNKQQFIKKS